ncbi:hypothetical protein [Mycolicibacterium fortuitum]|uniref:hypothetical protein n=1 Tax=Mycolicibacterium fortuitum TaxID=1766 RepID=UPI0034CE1ABF
MAGWACRDALFGVGGVTPACSGFCDADDVMDLRGVADADAGDTDPTAVVIAIEYFGAGAAPGAGGSLAAGH